MNEQKVTGKKIVSDFIVLARDLGVYLADIGKTVYAKIKSSLDQVKEKDGASTPTAVRPQTTE